MVLMVSVKVHPECKLLHLFYYIYIYPNQSKIGLHLLTSSFVLVVVHLVLSKVEEKDYDN